MFSAPQFFIHDDLTLAYYVAGDLNAPALILLHGFCMTAESNWAKTDWLEKLVESHYVIGLDIRGHGRSDKPHLADVYPASVMATDVLALADKLNITQFSLIGYSMGARMATFLASAQPARVDKLVIAGQAESLLSGIGGTDAIAMALRAPSLKSIKHPKLRQFRMLAEMGDNDLAALAACIDAPTPSITKAHLANISAQTLIIVGEHDQMAGDPHAVTQHFQTGIGAVIPECNHFTALTNQAFIDTATDFITR